MTLRQRTLLTDQLRAVDHRVPASQSRYRALQAEYRSNWASLRSEWEANTGQVWPKGHQAHHIIPIRYNVQINGGIYILLREEQRTKVVFMVQVAQLNLFFQLQSLNRNV